MYVFLWPLSSVLRDCTFFFDRCRQYWGTVRFPLTDVVSIEGLYVFLWPLSSVLRDCTFSFDRCRQYWGTVRFPLTVVVSIEGLYPRCAVNRVLLSKRHILDVFTKCRFHTPAVLPPTKNPSTHWMWDWVGPREVLDLVRKEKVTKKNKKKNRRREWRIRNERRGGKCRMREWQRNERR